MFGIGSTELLVILVVALIVLGPKSLASVSRSLGKAMGEFRRVSTDFQRTLNAESAADDIRQKTAQQQGNKSGDGASGKTAPAESADQADSLAPPQGSPLDEALAKAKAEADASSQAASDKAPAATSSISPVDTPRT